MKTPYIGFGNDQLAGQPAVKEGDQITCSKCKLAHPLQHGTSDGKKSTLLGFIICGKDAYLVSVAGKLVTGVKPACEGEL